MEQQADTAQFHFATMCSKKELRGSQDHSIQFYHQMEGHKDIQGIAKTPLNAAGQKNLRPRCSKEVRFLILIDFSERHLKFPGPEFLCVRHMHTSSGRERQKLKELIFLGNVSKQHFSFAKLLF